MVFRLLELLFHGVRALFRSTSELAIENVALRQQLSTFVNEGRRPQVQLHDRLFWVALRRLWGRWTDLLLFVKPDTVVRWHREGCRTPRTAEAPPTPTLLPKRRTAKRLQNVTGWRPPIGRK